MAMRLRFAPSPTGDLHLGGMRTALFNQLLVRGPGKHGSLVLRIEDTDRQRFVPGAAVALERALERCGIVFDESPIKGGPYGPYVQSERLGIYKDYAMQLLDRQLAYRCFCSSERLERARTLSYKRGLPPIYDGFCLSKRPEEAQARADANEPHVIRMKVPRGGDIMVHDLLRGDVRFQHQQIDDQVIIKSDSYPTYHLSSVVDDHLMEITHVIRGEEWLSSAPKHVLLYNSFGWKPPAFAHVPLLMTSTGEKLSKRHGNAASLDGLLTLGYLPEAVVNFAALCGWHPTGSLDGESFSEVLTMQELEIHFSLERVHTSPSIVDMDKLAYLSNQHMRMLFKSRPSEFLKRLREFYNEDFLRVDDDFLLRICETVVDRLETFTQFAALAAIFLDDPQYFTVEAHQARESSFDKTASLELVRAVYDMLSSDSSLDWGSSASLFKGLKQAVRSRTDVTKLMLSLRFALTASNSGPGVASILYALGRTRALDRLERALDLIGKGQNSVKSECPV